MPLSPSTFSIRKIEKCVQERTTPTKEWPAYFIRLSVTTVATERVLSFPDFKEAVAEYERVLEGATTEYDVCLTDIDQTDTDPGDSLPPRKRKQPVSAICFFSYGFPMVSGNIYE